MFAQFYSRKLQSYFNHSSERPTPLLGTSTKVVHF